MENEMYVEWQDEEGNTWMTILYDGEEIDFITSSNESDSEIDEGYYSS